MIIEIYSSAHTFNQYLQYNIQSALAVGIKVHVYIFPDMSIPAQTQVDNFLGFMKQNNLPYDMVWFDVENPSLWSTDTTTNQQFLA